MIRWCNECCVFFKNADIEKHLGHECRLFPPGAKYPPGIQFYIDKADRMTELDNKVFKILLEGLDYGREQADG